MSHGFKDFILFNGCEEVNFIEYAQLYGILDTISLKVKKKWNILKNFVKITFLPPSVMVEKPN